MIRPSVLRVGVIGVGVMGERHLRSYAAMSDVSVAGVYDPDQRRAAEVSQLYGGRVYSNPKQLFADVDALTVAAPTQYHARLALAAIEQQKHVLIEKPMAHTLTEASEIVDAAKQHPELVVNVGHIERFNPVVQALKACIGPRVVQRATFRRTSEFHGRCLDTDVIADLMIHDIDLALEFFGPVVGTVRANGSSQVTGDIDEASAHYTAASGTNVSLMASRVSSFKERAVEVLTDNQWIVADLLKKTISTTPFEDIGRAPKRDVPGINVTVVPEGSDALSSELRHFLDCIRTGSSSPVDSHAGVASMQLAECVRLNIPVQPMSESFDQASINA